MAVKIDCQPTIVYEARVSGRCTNSIVLGRTVDGGRPQVVRFDADENFVVLEVGKRGSGKSFGLGSALESFATVERSTTIGSHGENRRGVLLLDPLDIHWTAIYPIQANGSAAMKEQYARFAQWGQGASQLAVEPINVTVFMPAGRRTRPTIRLSFRTTICPFRTSRPRISPSFTGANLVSDPAGMLIGELLR